MGCTTRGGDYIQHKKRLLAIAAAGAALALSVVMIVSLTGDDKPTITTNPPPADDRQPASTPPTSGGTATSTTDDEDEYGNTHGPGNGNGDNDDDAGADDDDEDDPQAGDDKKTGLERAIEVHMRNMEKKAEKKNISVESMMEDGKGLANALEHLQLNLEKHQASQEGDDSDHDNNGRGKAVGNPHNT